MLGASSVAMDAQDQGFRRSEVLWLMAILALGTATVLFYTKYLIIGTGNPLSQAGVYVMMAAVLLGSPFGPYLSDLVGLPVSPALKRYLEGGDAGSLLLAAVGRGLLLALLLLPLILGEQWLVPKLVHMPLEGSIRFAPKQWMTGNMVVLLVFVSSIGAPLFEEITLRVFVFALFAWILGKLSGSTTPRSSGVLLAACVGQALVAGLGHVLGGANGLPMGPWYLQVAISPQTLGSFGLGLVYWRFGLETSMFTHFWGNFLANVVPVWLYFHRMWPPF
jgi:hypothetical protein